MKRFVNSVRNLPGWTSFWPRYYALKREGGRAEELEIRLRGGLVARVPGVLMSAFDEVFLREVYGRALSPPLGPAPGVIARVWWSGSRTRLARCITPSLPSDGSAST